MFYQKLWGVMFTDTADFALQDDRVLLRPLQREDHIHFGEFARSEPELWDYSLVAVTPERIRDYVDEAVDGISTGRSMPFIVYDKQRKAYAGSTRYYEIDLQAGSLLIGYTWYGRDFQRTGLNRHCKYLLLGYAFGHLGMERVEFRADARNTRSVAAMKAIGCTVEGVLRSHLPLPGGGRRDSVILSILKGEWEAGLRIQLERRLS